MTTIENQEILSSAEAGSAADPDPVLSVRNLGVSFGGVCVFGNVSFELPPRSMLGLLGPSGAGKSTLLRCLNRLIDLSPTARVTGKIVFGGRDIRSPEIDPDALRARIGMLFQQPIVFPVSIQENALFGARRLRRVPRRERSALVEKCLREAALWDQVEDRLDAPAATLSVGQQQRLCLARALATDPEAILLDEPTSALDADTTRAIEETFSALARSRSLVLVTHDPAQAQRLCDWTVRLKG